MDRLLVGTVFLVTSFAGGLMLITTPGQQEFLPAAYLATSPSTAGQTAAAISTSRDTSER